MNSIGPYLPRGWVCVPCPGSAHENPFIDNCNLCATLWGELVLPESAPTLEAWRALPESDRKVLRRRRARATMVANAARWRDAK